MSDEEFNSDYDLESEYDSDNSDVEPGTDMKNNDAQKIDFQVLAQDEILNNMHETMKEVNKVMYIEPTT